MSLPITIRRAHSGDLAFIYNSWLRSFKGSRDKHVDADTYFEGHHELIGDLLDSTNTTVLIARPVDDADTILGWCVKTNDTLHYVYVKEAFRRMGIARALVGEFKQHTHITPYGIRALGTKASTYNPYAARPR